MRRTETEAEMERLRQQVHRHAERVERWPEEERPRDGTSEQILKAVRGREVALEVLRQRGDTKLADVRSVRLEDLMVQSWPDEAVLANLRSNRHYTDANYWQALRKIAGAPTVRTISGRSGVPQRVVADVLKGSHLLTRDVKAVFDFLSARAHTRIESLGDHPRESES
ncbi:hypothetical protein ABZS96_43275 [Streptomyces avermitilis]|uniref:hypothetical protein n=1 Tax=Streptomyces avermitilis TaxID=33903 RepID=UPI0033AF648D